MTICIRTLSLALTAVVTLSASSAAFSEDTPNQIRVVSSYSWGSGCPYSEVEVTNTQEDLFNDKVYNKIKIFYGENTRMRVGGLLPYHAQDSVFCSTRIMMKVPAGYTLGNLRGFQNAYLSTNNLKDRLYIKSWVDVSDFDLRNREREHVQVIKPSVTSDGEVDFGFIGDLDDPFCHEDRYATITLTTQVLLDYYGKEGSHPTGKLEGTFFGLDPVDNKTNAVKCNAASGWGSWGW